MDVFDVGHQVEFVVSGMEDGHAVVTGLEALHDGRPRRSGTTDDERGGSIGRRGHGPGYYETFRRRELRSVW